MEERRKAPTPQNLSPDLKAAGRSQLEGEIRLIESWLTELNETSEDNTEAQLARKTYHDMLRSRQDLLEVLKRG